MKKKDREKKNINDLFYKLLTHPEELSISCYVDIDVDIRDIIVFMAEEVVVKIIIILMVEKA